MPHESKDIYELGELARLFTQLPLPQLRSEWIGLVVDAIACGDGEFRVGPLARALVVVQTRLCGTRSSATVDLTEAIPVLGVLEEAAEHLSALTAALGGRKAVRRVPRPTTARAKAKAATAYERATEAKLGTLARRKSFTVTTAAEQLEMTYWGARQFVGRMVQRGRVEVVSPGRQGGPAAVYRVATDQEGGTDADDTG